ncbi:hypothetical protein CEXT_36721 [Caerostris extrusa]|uniref:Uncharacterized protein n=1 Tax=Caerostris extrusa TaxID=172846 RepID=A0AAV4WSK3_CAEEX|nr:hypothetical protein CEXT_36721 [Caerostris extrusa]
MSGGFARSEKNITKVSSHILKEPVKYRDLNPINNAREAPAEIFCCLNGLLQILEELSSASEERSFLLPDLPP